MSDLVDRGDNLLPENQHSDSLSNEKFRSRITLELVP